MGVVESFLVQLDVSYIESPTCGFVSVQSEFQRLPKSPFPVTKEGP